MKPLLVGEGDPHNSNPRYVLYPELGNSTGSRLCQILGLTPREYLRAFDRQNLCTNTWDITCARACAEAIFIEYRGVTPIILLGERVCRAFRDFGIAYEPFTQKTASRILRGIAGPDRLIEQQIVVLPRPSEKRTWNDPKSVERAREVLRATGALPIHRKFARRMSP